jgi:methylated-DNA-protein-cysteine methyltransferase-like protein
MQMKNHNFFDKVYETVKEIPYGRVTSYGAIARYLGAARSARMVGWAMNHSHSQKDFIPAHRVVNRIGMLSGKFHFGNSTTLKQLLENEGAVIENDIILNFNDIFWDPSIELR